MELRVVPFLDDLFQYIRRAVDPYWDCDWYWDLDWDLDSDLECDWDWDCDGTLYPPGP